MPSARRLGLALIVPALLFSAACTSEADDVDSSADEINYRSTAGQEFDLSTTVTFAVPAEAQGLEGEARETAITTRADALRTSVTSAISAELDRIWPEDQRIRRTGAAIQFRQASATYRDLKASADGTRYTMTVSGEFAAVKDIERKLPMKTDGGKTFLPVSTDLGSGTEELQVFLTPVERSRNAYPKYLELFEDGLDIAVHVGGDHNEPPQDINHARSIYEDLVASGFRSPVSRFEDLKIDSAPLTSKIAVKGAAVDVRVRIFHVDMTPPDARQPLIDALGARGVEVELETMPGGSAKPLVIALFVYTIMTTWKRGRQILAGRLREASLPVDVFLSDVERRSPTRVRGTAVFMDRIPEGIPPPLLHNLKHNKILHERVVFLTVVTDEVPRLKEKERTRVEFLGPGFWRVSLHYGFMENPDVPRALRKVKLDGKGFEPMETTFFLGRETLIASKRPGMALWREHFFAWMSRSEGRATAFFNIPPGRVVELGLQVEL